MLKKSLAGVLSKTLAKTPDAQIELLKGWTGQPAVPQELKK